MSKFVTDIRHRSDVFVHVRLTGPVTVRAYTISNAVRLGNLTLVVVDARAARSMALLALLMEAVSYRLNYAYFGHGRIVAEPCSSPYCMRRRSGSVDFRPAWWCQLRRGAVERRTKTVAGADQT